MVLHIQRLLIRQTSKTKAENYRPISPKCICCKVMEHVTTSNTKAYQINAIFFIQSNMDSAKKTAAKPSLSNMTTLNENEQTNSIIMDFSKDFHNVFHRRIMLNLLLTFWYQIRHYHQVLHLVFFVKRKLTSYA